MRRLAIVLLVGCGGRQAPAPPASDPIDGWVIDAHGPVANAEVRVIAAVPFTCPCSGEPGNDPQFPTCTCPAALAQWRDRLARCEWPPRVLATTRSDAHGHVALPAVAGPVTIEASAPGGVRWLTTPLHRGLALELTTTRIPRIAIRGGTAIRGGFVFPDGHCVPLRRDGDAWIPVTPLPATEDVVVIVDTPGLAPIVRTWQPDVPLALDLVAATPITGTCEDGDTARLVNPYQDMSATLAAGGFRFTDVLAIDSAISCRDRGAVTGKWSYRPGEPLEEDDATIYGGFFDDPCGPVEVVDPDGHPIKGAEVQLRTSPDDLHSSSARSDAHGKACVAYLALGGELTVYPPSNRGGSCAGEAVRHVEPSDGLGTPVRIALAAHPVARENWRGRVLTPEHVPVAGAGIQVRRFQLEHGDCTELSDVMVQTELDGTFLLEALPRGTTTLAISHHWYAEVETEIVVGGPPRDVVLSRGASWTGRVLDPDGQVIDACQLYLKKPNQSLETGTCSRAGFTLATLLPGKSVLTVRLQDHALGTYRSLTVPIELVANEQRVQDVQWPRGETIAGRVVTVAGVAVPGARLTAIPKGTAELVNRVHPDEVTVDADANGDFVFRHLAPGPWDVRGDRRKGAMVHREIATGSTGLRYVVP